jgi:hypothetical protein
MEIPAAGTPTPPPPAAASHSRRRPRPGNRAQRGPQLASQGNERRLQRGRPPDNHHPDLGRSRVPARTVRLAQTASRTVALDRVLDLAAHGESDASRLGRFPPEHDERRPIDPSAPLEERLEFSAAGQPLASREATRYTVSRLRPLARRRLSTLRPPLVLMRARKPCVFARRRRFG